MRGKNIVILLDKIKTQNPESFAPGIVEKWLNNSLEGGDKWDV